ncbi:MAG: hypothetical protein RXQ94_09200, partial [Caldivirga sp.]
PKSTEGLQGDDTVKPESEDEEYEDEIEEYKGEDNHDKPEENEAHGCIELMRTFVVCRGKVYVFTVGKRTVVGRVIDIRRRFFRIVIESESGKVFIDLRKVSMIQEAQGED